MNLGTPGLGGQEPAKLVGIEDDKMGSLLRADV